MQDRPAKPATGANDRTGGLDLPLLLIIAVGYVVMFGPTFLHLSRGIWVTDEQGHGPIILAVTAWLFWNLRDSIAAVEARPATSSALGLMLLGVSLYVLGRSQDMTTVDAFAQIPILMALLLWFKGWAAVRMAWFPLFFLLFMVPLPSVFVQTLTVPLKMAVSYAAEGLLYSVGYPITRTGVILSIGQYQLLVADACAGLNSMFTLESLGLLYMNLMRYTSTLRNVVLAILIIPISFAANITRVCVLVLITYYFGDAAGQGFAHNLAGFVLFGVALAMIVTVDGLLRVVFKERNV